jgi:hypothetical protein
MSDSERPTIMELDADALRKLQELAEHEGTSPDAYVEKLVNERYAQVRPPSDLPSRPGPFCQEVIGIVARASALVYRQQIEGTTTDGVDYDNVLDGPLALAFNKALCLAVDGVGEEEEPDAGYLEGLLTGVAIACELDLDVFESVINALDTFWTEAHRRVCADWASTNGVVAKRKLGDSVSFSERGQTFTGVVRKIDSVLALYYVHSPEYERLIRSEERDVHGDVFYALPMEAEKPVLNKNVN